MSFTPDLHLLLNEIMMKKNLICELFEGVALLHLLLKNVLINEKCYRGLIRLLSAIMVFVKKVRMSIT